MKLIALCLLIYCATETVHCSRQWHLWDYLKKLTSYGDHGLVMPVQVRANANHDGNVSSYVITTGKLDTAHQTEPARGEFIASYIMYCSYSCMYIATSIYGHDS